MADRMLIDASHEEETRVVVVRGNRIEEFDFESEHKKQLRGNIYLAKVTRVEPSLQAAFVDYGGNRHGFLAFAEIHPDYYQIPLADRQALLAEEAEQVRREDRDDHEEPEVAPVAVADPAAAEQPEADLSALVTESVSVTGEEPAEKPKPRRKSRRKPKAGEEAEAVAAEPAAETADASAEAGEGASEEASAEDDGSTPDVMAAEVEADTISEEFEPKRGRRRGRRDDDDDDDDHAEKEVIESVGAEDAMEEVPDRVVRKPRKQYRIQEVIKRRQILLVQVAKEERGNKGAALTTYLSLAGRYSVLMPNTARGGGISRKITQPTDRKRLKEIARGLEVPQGMGVILRTAGANRTKVEIKRDFEYLMRLWENVRTLTLNSTAPCLVYEEGSLIKRSIRDLYNKDISEIIVAGEEGYREAKDFMKMLMPSHAKVVQPYRDVHPIFSRSGIEAQLDRMLQPQVTLKSGGYLIINQTEALVSIDVNSGRSTREHSIEETALATNLEAAEEVARQLRLRDLAGLVVIDFIDMEEKRNNRAVEKRLKDHLKNDRARIQVGRISHFGLLEMSRQRIRASVLESTTQVCSHCGGTGHVRSQSSVALHVLRGVEEYLLKNTTHDVTVRTTPDIALYLLNQKRGTIVDYEARFGLSIFIEADGSVGSQHFAIDRGDPVENPVKVESLMLMLPEPEEEDDIPVEEIDEEDEDDIVAAKAPAEAKSDDQNGRKRKRRRRRRGGRREDQDGQNPQANAGQGDDADEGDDEGDEGDDEADADGAPASASASDDQPKRKRRRRGKRGGRRTREEDGLEAGSDDAEANGEGDEGDEGDEGEDAAEVVAVEAVAVAEVVAEPAAAEPAPVIEAEPVAEAPAPAAETVAEPAPAAEAAPEEAEDKPAARTARTSASSGPIATEPVLTSGSTTEGGEPKPKKVGWWKQRGGFF
ncbi:Rne/Rng family ribonuclease [Rhizobium sp. C1]|uniref:Rne/Rng family ribonuclease n=1 Tax=Rhizobium sp. C1 TaxID=1349799 RepID=UPI001E51A25A|nr:ribonuclease E/G [Rhizobium sp. C1]MCD2177748.1 ribonuclease E/G [Rhizobium sp. C1]